MAKKILITGAAGFIGSHLSELLLTEGFKVVGLDNFDSFYSKELKLANLSSIQSNNNAANFSFYEVDICNKEQLYSIQDDIDLVVHIAAKAGVRPSIQNPTVYIDTNINGTQNVLDFMREREVDKIVFASSSSIYGNNKKTPFSELDDVGRPISPYAFTKRANELQIHTYHYLYEIDAICLRFFTVFGPRQRPDLAIRKFISLIQNNEPIEMYGDGSTGRDYTYVQDTVAGILLAINYLVNHKKVYEIVNLGNSKPLSLREMIDTIYEVLGKEKNIKQLPMQPGDVEQTFADISKAKELLNYSPKVGFKEGISRFIEWHKLSKK
ncbi:MAG: GDP-mannose 4,6-dehydratase [Chitinophagales bacterium]|nr:GDP-mannose 4,6-dehydratase [Bacteroidota bacterium]MCB9257621.1 GDP-mannose 4,6-dehydratase [Chitinophagales bacterium]